MKRRSRQDWGQRPVGRRRGCVWWLAVGVAGRIGERLRPGADALGGRSGCDVQWWRLVVRWLLLLLLFVGWRALAWTAALARGRRLAALGLAHPHTPTARLLPARPPPQLKVLKKERIIDSFNQGAYRSQDTCERRHVAHAFAGAMSTVCP